MKLDRCEYAAKVLGSDTANDIAVLKVVRGPVFTVTFGDPRAVQVGDWVLAIGAPYGFEQTATQGIVSASGPLPLPGDKAPRALHPDRWQNPGNSGGSVGLTRGWPRGGASTRRSTSQSGGFQVAFAIPARRRCT